MKKLNIAITMMIFLMAWQPFYAQDGEAGQILTPVFYDADGEDISYNAVGDTWPLVNLFGKKYLPVNNQGLMLKTGEANFSTVPGAIVLTGDPVLLGGAYYAPAGHESGGDQIVEITADGTWETRAIIYEGILRVVADLGNDWLFVGGTMPEGFTVIDSSGNEVIHLVSNHCVLYHPATGTVADVATPVEVHDILRWANLPGSDNEGLLLLYPDPFSDPIPFQGAYRVTWGWSDGVEANPPNLSFQAFGPEFYSVPNGQNSTLKVTPEGGILLIGKFAPGIPGSNQFAYLANSTTESQWLYGGYTAGLKDVVKMGGYFYTSTNGIQYWLNGEQLDTPIGPVQRLHEDHLVEDPNWNENIPDCFYQDVLGEGLPHWTAFAMQLRVYEDILYVFGTDVGPNQDRSPILIWDPEPAIVSTAEVPETPETFRVFPNPTADWVNVGPNPVQIMDLNGRLIASGQEWIDVSNLPAGKYYVLFENRELTPRQFVKL